MKKQLLFYVCALFALILSAQPGDIGIVGPAANGWPDPASNPTPDIMLTNNGDGTHTISSLTLTTGSAKFRTDRDWANPNYGGDTFPSGSFTSNDIPVQAGVYDLLVDLNTQTYTFTDVGAFTDIELVGTAVTGGNNPVMSTIDGINYELGSTEFLAGNIEFQELGTTTTYGDTAFPSGTATQGGAAIPVPTGFYQVSFNLSTGDYNFEQPVIGIVGPAVNGWPDANNQTPDVLMNTSDGDTYTLEDQVLLDGPMKFRQNQDWGVNWGGGFPGDTAQLGGGDIPAVAGTYDITFSRSNLTYAFTVVTASVGDESFANFQVYPNPTSDVWVFQNQNEAIAAINVFDQTGKLVLETAPQSFTGEIDAAVFISGLYLAQVQLTNGSQTTVKLFKK